MDFEKMREAAIAELEGFRVLEESTDAAERQRAAFIAAALNTLPQQEQEILRQFFIDRRCRYAGHRAKLQAMYGLISGMAVNGRIYTIQPMILMT